MEKDLIRTVVDAGNTRVKIAQFKGVDLASFQSFEWTSEDLPVLLEQLSQTKTIYSSVADEQKNNWLQAHLKPELIFTQRTSVPIDLRAYQTISTLGTDRIANAVAAHHFSKTSHALVVDCGTCIKFDFIEEENYLGGSISPGFQMRFNALHDYTGKLPLIQPKNDRTVPALGNSTSSSIQSGVVNGLIHEINGFINHYTKKYSNLTIFLTGGDANLFDLHNKNTIFVDSYLTLKGLYLILKYNGG